MADLLCPKCQAPMRSYERSGVTVDRCTECRGIFLDAGELERLMGAEAGFNQPPEWARSEYGPRPKYEREHEDEHDSHYRQRRRGGFLNGLLGGDD